MDKSPTKIQTHVIAVVHRFLVDSGAERASRGVSIDAQLERDLGIGSLEKAELFHRIEKAFNIRLPDSLMVEANVVNDLVNAVIAAKPKQMAASHEIAALLEAKQTDPSSATTLMEVLQLYASHEPNRPHIYLQNEMGEEEVIRYGQLYEMSRNVAQGLVNHGLKPGDTVAIMVPTSSEFFYSFFGTLLAGGIPVPIYPPFRADQIEEYAKREALILRNASVRLLITFRRAESLSKLLKAFIPSLLAVTTVEALLVEASSLPELQIETTYPALIQYTSGSTGNPKGVLLTHANLLANMRAYGQSIQIKPTDVGVSWLPLYHDMGLIGAWLGSLYHGIPLTSMSPLAFLSRPERWLWAIHYHRATLSAGPNFAYELCIKKIDDADIEGLDLSSWRLAFNGAEMIYPQTMRNFVKRFARYGFRKNAFFPVYGLAECSLALAFPSLGEEPRIDRIQRLPFETENRAVPVQPGEKQYQELAGCGKAITQHEIRIVDDHLKTVAERMVGNVQFRGPSAMQGYYCNPEATQAIYHDGWWDTGDLGYLAEGDLFISGRKKDLIVKAGRNYYPAEIEEISGQVEGVRKGCVAAFGVDDANRGTEKLIVVAETSALNKKMFDEIRKKIIDNIVSHVGIPPDEVVLVPPQTIPKTSSGKLRRSSCKTDYLTGKLGRRSSRRVQVIRLFFQSRWKKLKTGLPIGIKVLYNIYVFFISIFTLLPTLFWVWVLPRPQAVTVSRQWCRWMFRLCFCPITIKGEHHLQTKTPMIFIANHSSYVDVFILAGVLPSNSLFVAKKELLKIALFSKVIKKLGHLTVDRMDFSKGEADTQQIIQKVQQGYSVIIFPEGTFTYATGIRPFTSGAFKIAVESQRPICPVAIKGARKILRGNAFLLQPSPIDIIIGEPLVPQASDWSEIIRLREASRLRIIQYSGERSIDLIKAGLPKK